MSRLLGVAVVVLVVGLVVGWSTSARATASCGRAGAPPAPRIDAVRDGDRIRVEYSAPRPAGCVPDAVLITVASVAKPDNAAPSPTNGLMEGTEGTAEFELPPLDLPPYEVRAVSLTPRGRRSTTVTVRVARGGDSCGHDSCLALAEEKLERCLRGLAPRSACPGYLWRSRPPIPYEPLQDVTLTALEQSFSTVAKTPVTCFSPRECLVGDATFALSGHKQRAGCWIAESGLNRYRACVDWKWNG